MTITITCPTCKHRYDKIKPEYAGKTVRCSCGQMIRLIDNGERTDCAIDEVVSDQSKRTPASSSRVKSAPENQKSRQTSKPQPPKSVIDVHYSDLDDILGKPPAPDHPFDPRSTPQRTASPIKAATENLYVKGVQGPAALDPNRKKTDDSDIPRSRSSRQGLSFLLAIASASLAFWFSVFLMVVRFSGLRNSSIQFFSQSFASIFSGQVGVDEMLPSLRSGLVAAGWIVLILAFLFAALAAMQFANAAFEVLARKTLFRWSDGLSASVAMVLVFVLIVAVFLHNRHIYSLKQKIEPAAGAEVADTMTITAIKKDLAKRESSFIGSIAISAMIPLCVFACSMIRLFLHENLIDENRIDEKPT